MASKLNTLRSIIHNLLLLGLLLLTGLAVMALTGCGMMNKNVLFFLPSTTGSTVTMLNPEDGTPAPAIKLGEISGGGLMTTKTDRESEQFYKICSYSFWYQNKISDEAWVYSRVGRSDKFYDNLFLAMAACKDPELQKIALQRLHQDNRSFVPLFAWIKAEPLASVGNLEIHDNQNKVGLLLPSGSNSNGKTVILSGGRVSTLDTGKTVKVTVTLTGKGGKATIDKNGVVKLDGEGVITRETIEPSAAPDSGIVTK